MPNGEYQAAPEPERTEVISANAARTLREMMETVVSDEGTMNCKQKGDTNAQKKAVGLSPVISA